VSDDYEGVTVAGLAVVRFDGEAKTLLAQRTFDETDDKAVQESWEFVGGHLNPGEEPFPAAQREFVEEIGFDLPNGEVLSGWRSDDGHYQGFVYEPEEFPALGDWQPTSEVQAVAWFTREEAMALGNLRPEVRSSVAWDLIDAIQAVDTAFTGVSGNKERKMSEAAVEAEPEWDVLAAAVGPIPVHGVIAPEDVATGDGRGFNAGSMTRRPMRLPFSDQHVSIGGHDGSVVTGSVDRMMRKDGLIHWEGALMPSEETERLVARMQFFGGRYGVSVDGDNGSLDTEKVKATGIMWFDAVRAAGLTAVAIPAFHEAYVAFGYHPDMPDDDTDAVLAACGIDQMDIAGARRDLAFDRGPGWVTNPVETKRIHDYWTKKGEEGYAKVGWGTPGDFTRAKKLIGAKIAANSPEDMRFLNQIIAQWHFDALGYWPGDLGKPGNPPDTQENRERAARHAAAAHGIEFTDDGTEWETVLTASGKRVKPPAEYFTRHPNTGATVVDEADENGLYRTYGYAAEWGVCHIGFSGRCVEPPRPDNADFPDFHLGYTRLDDGTTLNTGVLTYLVEHRDAQDILTETAEQQHFDNVANAWAAVRLGIDERGIWFSGVVLPGIPEADITLIEATGQVSGEWKYGSLRALQSVNTPGFGVLRSSAAFDDEGNVTALVAVTTGKDMALVASMNGVEDSECVRAEAKARMEALRKVDEEIRASARMKALAAKMGA